MTVVEQVLIVIAVTGLLFVLLTGVASVMLVRGVRRRYRAVRSRMTATWGEQVDLGSLVRRSGSVAAASVGSPGWWVVQNHRHRLWKAVTSAEHAVGVARRADVAVGDLPFLAGRLRAAATGIDAVLRASGPEGALRGQDRADYDRIVEAAGDLHAAAMSSLRSGSHADTETVVTDVRIELAALAAGIRAAHG